MPPARRFLAPAARYGNGHGYLTRPQRPLPDVADPPEVAARPAEASRMCDEPESPSQAWVNANAELAAEYNRLRLLAQVEQARLDRRLLTIENRIRDAQRRAKLKRVDVTGEVHVMRKMLERGNREAAAARCEQVEARLDGVPLDEAA